MPSPKNVVTIRFHDGVLELARVFASTADPPLSLNTAINLLISAGAERVNPCRLTDLRTLTDLANLAESLSIRLDTEQRG